MRDLDKNEIYYTGSLNKNQLEILLDWLNKNDTGWEDYSIDGFLEINGSDSLKYSNGSWGWESNENQTKNAKELFYTLENVQVDCRELRDEQIKEMVNVFEKASFNLDLDEITGEHFYLRLAKCEESVDFFKLDNTKTTITYEKFMELFSDTLVGDVIEGTETTDEVSPIKLSSLFSSREKENEKRTLKLKKTLKYLLKRDIILTPKQYKKLWKK